jgi:hypothetical protein
MPLIRNVEKRIWNVEHFEVVIKHADSRAMRGDKSEIRMYPFDHATKNSRTVSEWKERRFKPNYPDLDVDVLDAAGQPLTGHTLLCDVRDSYSDDDD